MQPWFVATERFTSRGREVWHKYIAWYDGVASWLRLGNVVHSSG
jgi:hypothetical protein